MRSGTDVRQVKRQDAGAVLADSLRQFLFDLQVEDGLAAVGYSRDDIPALVKGTIPQVSHVISCLMAFCSTFVSFLLLLSAGARHQAVSQRAHRGGPEPAVRGLHEALLRTS